MQDFLHSNTQVVMFTAAEFREIVNTAAEEIARNTIGEVLPLPSQTECEEEYLSRREVADKFGVNLSTLWRWNKDGFLPCIKIGRKVVYAASAIREFIDRNKSMFNR